MIQFRKFKTAVLPEATGSHFPHQEQYEGKSEAAAPVTDTLLKKKTCTR